MRIKSVTFSKLKTWLSRNHNCLPVFLTGGKNHFEVHSLYGGDIVIIGSQCIGLVINESQWTEMMDYLDSLSDEQTFKTASFAPGSKAPVFNNCAAFGPNFQAICKAYWMYHKTK